MQRHFFAAIQRVADLPHAMGYDGLNEPGAGYIGRPSLSTPLRISNEGPRLTGFEMMMIPASFARSVPYQQRHGVETSRTAKTCPFLAATSRQTRLTPTYLPHIQYLQGFMVTVSNGRTCYNSDIQLLTGETDTLGEQLLIVEQQ